MKYKAGDKVRVHTKEWFDNNCARNDLFNIYGSISSRDSNSFVPDMQKLCGQIVTIKNVRHKSYLIQEDNERWNWEDWMFEDMNNNTNTISNSNIVEDFAKLIGVELDEEFYDEEHNYYYKITDINGLMVYNTNTKLWQICKEYSINTFFKMIKEGKFMKKWMPKDGDIVFFPAFCFESLRDCTTYDSENEYDKKMLKNGLYFRTQEEAIECAKKMLRAIE